jgi:hypothetical protein
MKRRLSTHILMGVVLAIVPPLAQCKVIRASLSDLVGAADQIVIGRVVAVDLVEGVKIATFEVEAILKGAELGHLYFLASPTWACDITDAELGEHVLLFLVKHTFGPRPEFAFTEPPGLRTDVFKAEMSSRSGIDQFFEISWSGRGRMQLTVRDGIEYVQAGAARLPKWIASISISSAENTSRVPWVRLNEFVAAIKDQLREMSLLNSNTDGLHPRLK